MLKNNIDKNLDRTSLDSLSDSYLSDHSPDDLSLLHRLNTLLSSKSLPRLTNLLDVTPSLLVALYETHPTFQRVPFVDVTVPDFATKLRNMKLLVSSIAGSRNGYLTERKRRQLERLDLRKFCEKDLDAIRDTVEILVDVGERGLLVGTGSGTPGTKRRPQEISRSVHKVEKVAGNSMEGPQTSKKKHPVLVLPTTKVDDHEISTDDKDSGWDGSILGAMSQSDKVGSSKGRLTRGSDLRISDLKSRKVAQDGRSTLASTSSSSSSVPPGYLEHLSARVNAIVARCPAQSPQPKEKSRGRGDVDDTTKGTKKQQTEREDYSTSRRVSRRSALGQRQGLDSDQFGGELKAPRPTTASTSSSGKFERKPNEAPVSRGQKATSKNTKRGAVNRTGKKRESRKEQERWGTESESGFDTSLSFSSLARKDTLDSRTTRRSSAPVREIGINLEVAAHTPLPTSRPGSTTSHNSRPEKDQPLKSPLPLFPQSLLRTMYWATSLPTPPLSPNAQKWGSRLAATATPSTSKPQLGKLRRTVSASPLPASMLKKRSPAKRHGSAGLMEARGAASEEWASNHSHERLSAKGSYSTRGTPLRPPKELLAFAVPPALASAGRMARITKNDPSGRGRELYNHEFEEGDTEPDDTDYGEDDDDDRTSIYSASTVSWGEDDPFTAALRQRRQLALEKLHAMERSFNEEIEVKKQARIESREPSVSEQWRPYSDTELDVVTHEGYDTDSEGGCTDVEEELRLLEEIGKREADRQQLLLKRLVARGGT
ncbi:uncharacterized protein H6S33_008654 [Morchella sextelata]|uniref:uncharacterized protein n=1 Tax=Morchella sextelata TaxID=1174677 RepID=UPI001D04A68D|nr:uncharacterized protein H6S33_008654 [Morchella sextelata]KAH0602573.1 hypothetical protein H6S33_008654 [Morchella sextelata]